MAEHFRPGQPGVEAEYIDAAACIFRQRLCKVADPDLAGTAGILQRDRALVAAAEQVDQLAALLFDKIAYGRHRAVVGPGDIRISHTLKVLAGDVGGRPVRSGEAGVVGPDVEPAN